MTIPEHQNDNRAAIDIATLAEASAEVAATRARLKKIALLSECLGRVSSDELPIAVKFLSGELTQGRIGLGAAAVRRSYQAVSAANTETPPESVSLAEVDSVFSEIAAVKGRGSTARRDELMRMLLQRVSTSTRQFLLRLILGELRHGAQEGILIEAVANNTEVPAADIRRAVMLTGDLAQIASTARPKGPTACTIFRSRCFDPYNPCWPSRPRILNERWRRWAPLHWNTSWTEFASKCTNTATRSGCSRVISKKSPATFRNS